MNKLISIFIPTYNRAHILDSILTNVIDAINKYNIRIYIYDNASTDNTEEIVSKHITQYSNIIYHKNKENLGIDKNMLFALDCVDSKYLLMLGDDDYIYKNFYPIIEPYLYEEFNFIALARESEYLTEKSQIFDNKEVAFCFLWDKLPYGTIIIRTGIVNKSNMTKYIGTSHAYSAALWESMLFPPSKILYLSEKLLVNLGTYQKTWSSQSVNIHFYQIPLWFSLLPENYISKNKISRISRNRMFSLRSLFSFKLNNDLKSVTSKQFFTPYEKLKYQLVNIFPSNILKYIYNNR